MSGREVVWVTADELVEAHNIIIDATGGRPGVLNDMALLGALDRGPNRVSYSAAPPTISELSAVMVMGVAQSHAFCDGNKRTALYLLNEFLNRNGLLVDADDWEMERAILAVVNGEMKEADFIFWVDSVAKEIEDFFPSTEIEDIDPA